MTRPAETGAVRGIVCPEPLSHDELLRVADSIDRMPQGKDIDYLAGIIEYFNDASLTCVGEDL